MLGGSALLLGALVGYFVNLPQRVVAGVMAAGSGVLVSAVAFELVDVAYLQGGFLVTAGALLGGALVYSAANVAVSGRGALHRKRSGSHPDNRQAGPDAGVQAGLAIALGALLDGIPESVAIGASLLEGSAVSLATVGAVFLSNLPEGLSSSAGMRRAGRSKRYVFGVWGGIALASGVAAMAGNWALAGAAPAALAIANATAAGAILAMIIDTMIPEATEEIHEFSGLIAVVGFLAAFALSKLA